MYPGPAPHILARDQPAMPFEERMALAERIRGALT
jgi:hypothetical protein